jgi:hypothetical protein
MIDDATVLRVERLRDDVEELGKDLRQKVRAADGTVRSAEIKNRITETAERWLVEVAPRPDIAAALGGTVLADRNVHFQRVLTFAERATQRRKYDQAFAVILRNFRGDIVVPLKARRTSEPQTAPLAVEKTMSLRAARVVFVGKSFAPSDDRVNACAERVLSALGLKVVTGEKPKAEIVSRKVKTRIDSCDIFVGIFSRREKLEGKEEWTTSPWVIDEKAYALARNRKLVLLREFGITSIGGLQGDYEYIQFDRTKLEELAIALVETFRSDD